MIYDAIKHTSLYRGLGPRFALAFDYLARFDVNTAVGRVSLEGDDVYALTQSYQTSPAAARPYESHRVYADVQFVAAGEELIYFAPLDCLQVTRPYAANDDAVLYSGADVVPLGLRAGDFSILFPQDGHKPCCQWHQSVAVKKVVVKVRL